MHGNVVVFPHVPILPFTFKRSNVTSYTLIVDHKNNKQKKSGLSVSLKTHNKFFWMSNEQLLCYCRHRPGRQRTNIKLGHSCFPSRCRVFPSDPVCQPWLTKGRGGARGGGSLALLLIGALWLRVGAINFISPPLLLLPPVKSLLGQLPDGRPAINPK